jgi:hypothetical protein
MKTSSPRLTIKAAAVQECRRLANSRRVFLLLMGLTMTSLMPNQAAAADHIQIVREVVLESGHSAMAKQLAPTNDGGIIVAGSFSNWKPWATRVDAEGKVRWRYLPEMKQSQPGADDAGYETAATLPDDTTVLSGYMYVRNPTKAGSDVVGLLTHLDRTGKVISHRELYPQGDHGLSSNYLRRSVPWGDGVVVIGDTGRARKVAGDYVQKNFFWLIALDAKGEIKWEKLIPNTDPRPLMNVYPLVGVAAMPGHELVLVTAVATKRGNTWESGRRVIRLDDKGDTVSERLFPGSLVLAHQVTPKSEVTLFPDSLENGALWTVSSDLVNAKQIAGRTEWIFTRAACRSSTGALILAGSVQGKNKATVAWLDADLKTTQTHVFQPEDASGWVTDVLPTAKPDEFVTVRDILGGGGAALTFVKIK